MPNYFEDNMTSIELINLCYSTIDDKTEGKYRKQDMARDMGLSPQDLSGLFSGNRKIGMAYAEKISAALSKHGITVTPGHILDGLSQENWELIPEHNEHRAETTYLGEVEDETVPLLTSIPAGDWKTWIDDFPRGYGEETVPRLGLRGKHVFALRVEGDSMVGDDLHPGDILYIDPEKEFLVARGGRIGVVKRDGDYKIRRVMYAGDGEHYRLVPSNPNYEEELVPIDEVKVFKIVRWMPMQNGKF